MRPTDELAAAYIEAAADAIVATDEAGNIVLVNAQTELLFGYSAAELIGQPIEMLVPDQHSRNHVGHRNRYHAKPAPRKMGDDGSRVHGQSKNGCLVPVEIALSPVDSAAQRGVIAIIRDITERVEAEQLRAQRELLLAALAEIRKAASQETSIDEVLGIILRSACRLLKSEHAFVVIPNHEGGLVYRAMCSKMGPDLSGRTMSGSTSIKNVLLRGEPVLVPSAPPAEPSNVLEEVEDEFLPDTPLADHGIMVPLLASSSIEGALVVARCSDDEMFSAEETAIAASLGSETAVTLELAHARSDRRRMFLVEDRERIARDLHDVVIQRIFAAGMSLNASLGNSERLIATSTKVIDELDATIDVIRETIFKLTQVEFALSSEVGRVVDRYRTMGRNDVQLSIAGDLDGVPESVGVHLLPTLNELLSNVERHANATTATAQIDVDTDNNPGRLTLTVRDDGSGIDHDKPHGFGIRNITNRAEHLDGSVQIDSEPDGSGTTVVWSVSLESGITTTGQQA